MSGEQPLLSGSVERLSTGDQDSGAHLQQALIFLSKALAIQQRIENRAREWITLSNIGWVYELQGKFQEALTMYAQSIELLEQIIVFTGGLEELKISLGAQIATTYQRTIREQQ